MTAYSVYVHIPFCRHRCAYCDFNTYAGQNELIPAYIDALKVEIKNYSDMVSKKYLVHSIYFGGGTPSLLTASSIAEILETAERSFDLAPNVEISLEANPGNLSSTYLQDLFSIGINRLSLGAQSVHQNELTFLERLHQYTDVIDAVMWARQTNFYNISLDLIFGILGQNIDDWEKTLTLTLALKPEHFSLYALSIEEGTPMYQWSSRGLLPHLDPDLVADMYELASEKLSNIGYQQYEISNWAKLKEKTTLEKKLWICRHNLQYWRNRSYIGFGAGAHGYHNGYRMSNVLHPKTYIKRLLHSKTLPKFPLSKATLNHQKIDLHTAMNETMMMGLRLTEEGISRIVFQERFHRDLLDVYGKKIEKLIHLNLLEWVGSNDEILRLTTTGRLLGNQVFYEFI